MRRAWLGALGSVALLAACRLGRDTRAIRPGDSFEMELKAPEVHSYSVAIDAGESALVIVNQMGIDVAVDVEDAAGKTIASVDSPNGRNGDEPVLIEPEDRGTHTLQVRPIDASEPAGKYGLRYVWWRTAQATGAVLHDARRWLMESSTEIPASGVVPHTTPLPALDRWLNGVRVVGMGEATHGSRELGDLRLSLTKLLIERYGFRAVAIEASADKYRTLAPYIAGETSTPLPSLPGPGWIWIGQRTQRALIEWVRGWNMSHATEPVRIVGVDANDNGMARELITGLIAEAYRGTDVVRTWPAAAADLTAADEQSFVFGDSGIHAATWKVLARLAADRDSRSGPWRKARGDAAEALSILMEFAAFNADGDIGDVPRSRDIYMGRRVLAALEGDGMNEKAVYWAHNAHVVHAHSATRTAGAVLRKELGLAYVAIATTFGEGSFLAQIPNDAEDRLAITRLPRAPSGAAESMFARLGAGGSLALWRPDLTEGEMPQWFQVPRRMHWVGGLYRTDTDPSQAFQPYMLIRDFDGIAYVATATAEDVIAQPHIPARR